MTDMSATISFLILPLLVLKEPSFTSVLVSVGVSVVVGVVVHVRRRLGGEQHVQSQSYKHYVLVVAAVVGVVVQR